MAASNTYAALRSDSATSPTTSPDHYWRPAASDRGYTLDCEEPVIVREWMFEGAGWLTSGDAALAASAAARAREQRAAAALDQPIDPDDL